MPTAIEHVKAALSIIGQNSPILPAPPDMLQRGLSVFNTMIARWVTVHGMEFEVQRADVPGDEVYNDEWATPMIQYNLGVLMCPECNITATPDVVQLADNLLREGVEYTRLLRCTPGRSMVDTRLPIGSGNDRGVLRAPRFYGRGTWGGGR